MSNDLRLLWRIDWHELMLLLVDAVAGNPTDALLLVNRLPYRVTMSHPHQQKVWIYLARPMPGDVVAEANDHPLEIYIGALCELIYRLHVEPFPDGYFCDEITLADPSGPAVAFLFTTPDGEERALTFTCHQTIELRFRLGPRGQKETRPNKIIRAAISQDIAEAEVWPWHFKGFVRAKVPPQWIQIPHVCDVPDPTQPFSYKSFSAESRPFSASGRGFVIYAAKCPSCRRIYWLMGSSALPACE
jgi:hypothetical protein